MAADYAGLVKRLERATGPDRELDWDIAEALGGAIRRVSNLGLSGRTRGGCPVDEHGDRCDPKQAVFFRVVMKTGPGQWEILSDDLPKRSAARQMRQIRQEMAKDWLSARSARSAA